MIRRWKRSLVAGAVIAGAAGAGFLAWELSPPTMPVGLRALTPGPASPGALTAAFLGTTTLLFNDGHDAVMIDALVTRPSMRQVLFGKVASDPDHVAYALGRLKLSHLQMLLITHSHYDHILDAAAVAARTGAMVVGSPSTRQVMLGAALPTSHVRTVRGGERLHAGSFVVTVFRSLHSAGDRVPGAIVQPLRTPASVKEFKEGGTLAFLIDHRNMRVLVHASANARAMMYRGVRADIVFLAVGGLASQPASATSRYWDEVVRATGAKLVIPIHWDNFLEPLDQPLQPLPRLLDDIPLTLARLQPLAARDKVTIRSMPIAAPVSVSAAIAQSGVRP